jgi:nucleoside-diphosphate-sugar epimerase
VRDVCAAALHLAMHPAADGEAYNVSDDGRVDAIELARIVGSVMGTTPKILPPAPISVVRKALSGAARISTAAARRSGKRPFLEYDQVQYFGHNYLYSNDKLKRTGFRFRWPQPEPGLRETLRWYLDHGWIERPEARPVHRR